MSTNQDARPFVDLKKDAQEFRMKFDEDIEDCLNFLDEKITSLICEPDSFGISGKSVHQNALSEFSKAKYDIFISIKSLINAKEREWLDYIDEMKKLFVENVEIFLAGTKLEVKLPPQESMLSHGPRKSPGNRKSNSTSVTSSIYPIISSFTKNIPVLGSPFQSVTTSSISKSNVKKVEDYDEEIESYAPRSNSISRRLSNSGINTSRSSSGGRNSLEKGIITDQFYQKSSDSDEIEVLADEIVKEVPLKGRRGRAAQKSKANNMTVITQNDSSTDENDVLKTEIPEKEVPLKGRRGRAAQKPKTNNSTVITQYSSSTDENDILKTEISEKEVPLKGRRGRAAQNAKTTNLTAVASKISNIDEIKGPIVEMMEIEVPVKGRRGKLASKAKTNDLAVKTTAIRGRKSVKPAIQEEIHEAGPSNYKKVSFNEEHSSSDEMDIQTPLSRPLKSAARRKTLLPNLEIASGADIIPGLSNRLQAKRKTISGVSELESMVPSKRLKGNRKSSSQEEDSGADNLLESDGNYSEWMPLKSVDGKIPTHPALYEVKVWRAKKPAYIGSCENLRHKLTLYNLRQNSGHKHLDKFIERNYNEIQVRYEIISSFNDAKQEVKNRIENFKAQHKNPPAYN